MGKSSKQDGEWSSLVDLNDACSSGMLAVSTTSAVVVLAIGQYVAWLEGARADDVVYCKLATGTSAAVAPTTGNFVTGTFAFRGDTVERFTVKGTKTSLNAILGTSGTSDNLILVKLE